jgi:hypothetical protein
VCAVAFLAFAQPARGFGMPAPRVGPTDVVEGEIAWTSRAAAQSSRIDRVELEHELSSEGRRDRGVSPVEAKLQSLVIDVQPRAGTAPDDQPVERGHRTLQVIACDQRVDELNDDTMELA